MAKFGVPQPESLVTGRRQALGLGVTAAALPLLGFEGAAVAEDGMFSVPPLPYAYVRALRAECAQPFCCKPDLPHSFVAHRMPSSHMLMRPQ